MNQGADKADKKENEEVKYPQFQLKGLLQARYLESFGDNVDVLGTQHSTGDATQSSFDIKRMRVGLNTKLSETTEIVILVNLADFKSDTKGKFWRMPTENILSINILL